MPNLPQKLVERRTMLCHLSDAGHHKLGQFGRIGSLLQVLELAAVVIRFDSKVIKVVAFHGRLKSHSLQHA